MHKRVKGYRRALYVDLDPSKHAEVAVKTLHGSLAGLGTNEANLIRVLATLPNDEMVKVSELFNSKYGSKGDLVKWIRDDTSGDVTRILSAMAKDQAEADADALHKAMKGLGTDEEALMLILCDRSLIELERINVVFKRKYGEKGDLKEWLADDTSGEFKEWLVALADRADYMAQMLQGCLSGSSPDVTGIVRLISKLRTNERVRDLIKDLEDEAATPSVAAVKAAYLERYKESLEQAVYRALPGHACKLAMAMIEDSAEDDVRVIKEAVDQGSSKAEKVMVELLTTRSPNERLAIDEAYDRKYSVKLEMVVQGFSSANYRKTLMHLARPRSVALAHALHDAITTSGTDDDRLILLLTHRCKKEVRETAVKYHELYGANLVDAIKRSTRGWYRKTLCFIIREAFQTRVHVPPQWLILVRDVDV